MGFGKANLENAFEGFKYFKLRTPDSKKGEEMTELVVRLLPAMHSYEDSGEWKFFYGQHYGHFGVNSRNPEKPRSRPFGCIQKKNKAKEIVVRCPKCDQIERARTQYEARENALAAEHGVDKKGPEFRELKRTDSKLKSLGEWLSSHNCDKKFWVNVMSLNGEFGVLQLSYSTTMEKLIPFLKRLRDQDKLDAFDPNGGVWLRFTRSGTKPRVVDDVETYDELVDIGNGRKAKVPRPAPMTADQIEKALKICPDLKKDVVKFIDAETMERLVKSSGDPEETDRIWPPEPPKNGANELKTTGLSKAAAAPAPGGDDDEFSGSDDSADETPPVSKLSSAPAPTPAPEVDDEEAELERKLAAKRAAKAAKQAAPTIPPPTQSAGGDPIDDFLSKFSS